MHENATRIKKIFSKTKHISIIDQQQSRLNHLTKKSARAIDIVTSTISSLFSINEEIDEAITEINEQQSALEATRANLVQTKESNRRIAENFQNLIES